MILTLRKERWENGKTLTNGNSYKAGHLYKRELLQTGTLTKRDTFTLGHSYNRELLHRDSYNGNTLINWHLY